MIPYSRPKIFLILALSLVFTFCSLQEEKSHKNVIFITLDTQRADYISVRNPEKSSTPNIDFLAREGIFCENCYSLIPITAPAHASIFYSLPPHLLQLYNNGQIFHPQKNLTSLAEVFRNKGVKTAAFVSLGVLQSHFQLNQGFDHFDDSLSPNRWYLHAQEVNDKVFSWIQKNKDHDFFVWIHYSDPHDPYAPPSLPPDLRIDLNGELHSQICLQKYERLNLNFKLHQGKNEIRFTVLNPFPDSDEQFRAVLNDIEFFHPESMRLSFEDIHFVQRGEKKSALIKKQGTIKIDNPENEGEFLITARGNLNLSVSEKVFFYKQEVEYMDHQIGNLTEKLKEWKLLGDCLVVLVGDHGEGLGENTTGYGERYFGHIHYLYGRYMKVPLVFFDESLKKKGVIIKDLTTLLDVAPTVLGLMGWKKQPFYQGIDLVHKRRRSESILEETYSPEAIYDRFGLIQHPWHLVLTPAIQKFELYDLVSDPDEKQDVFARYNGSKTIKNLIKILHKRTSDILQGKKEVAIDKKSLEMLKSLGYIK
jgi:membrane-anchored protein YejM (alkaline phosphatase superfamily)